MLVYISNTNISVGSFWTLQCSTCDVNITSSCYKRDSIINIRMYRGEIYVCYICNTGSICITWISHFPDILHYDSIQLNLSCLLLLRWMIWPVGLLYFCTIKTCSNQINHLSPKDHKLYLLKYTSVVYTHPRQKVFRFPCTKNSDNNRIADNVLSCAIDNTARYCELFSYFRTKTNTKQIATTPVTRVTVLIPLSDAHKQVK